MFPRYRLVGYSGGPGPRRSAGSASGDLDDRVRRSSGSAAPTAGGREVLPVLELITVIVHASAGADGMYRSRIDAAVIERYLAAARRHRAVLLLNIQPGRAGFLDEVQRAGALAARTGRRGWPWTRSGRSAAAKVPGRCSGR